MTEKETVMFAGIRKPSSVWHGPRPTMQGSYINPLHAGQCLATLLDVRARAASLTSGRRGG